MSEQIDAILLASFGGPEGQDDVIPFLENVTRGRGVPRERLESVAGHYRQLGGVSPINEQNRALIAAIEAELANRGIDLPVYWGNRNWAPYFADAVQQMHDDGHRRVLAVTTSAYSSYSGCRQYREDIAGALVETELTGTLTIEKVRAYFDSPGFLEPFADGIVAALADLGDVAPVEVLFTTHSIPITMNDSSGPKGGAYVAQHEAAAELVAQLVRDAGTAMPPWSVVFQSRSGPPQVPWLEPDINDAIRAASERGVRAVVVVPLGFVSDHVEVIWDLDTEAAQTCEEIGIEMRRVTTPGTDPRFVSSLVDLIAERLGGAAAPALSNLGPWRTPCAAGCCPTPRRPQGAGPSDLQSEKPHVAGADSPF